MVGRTNVLENGPPVVTSFYVVGAVGGIGGSVVLAPGGKTEYFRAYDLDDISWSVSDIPLGEFLRGLKLTDIPDGYTIQVSYDDDPTSIDYGEFRID